MTLTMLDLSLIPAEMYDSRDAASGLSWLDFDVPCLEIEITASQTETAERQEEVESCLERISRASPSQSPILARCTPRQSHVKVPHSTPPPKPAPAWALKGCPFARDEPQEGSIVPLLHWMEGPKCKVHPIPTLAALPSTDEALITDPQDPCEPSQASYVQGMLSYYNTMCGQETPGGVTQQEVPNPLTLPPLSHHQRNGLHIHTSDPAFTVEPAVSAASSDPSWAFATHTQPQSSELALTCAMSEEPCDNSFIGWPERSGSRPTSFSAHTLPCASKPSPNITSPAPSSSLDAPTDGRPKIRRRVGSLSSSDSSSSTTEEPSPAKLEQLDDYAGSQIPAPRSQENDESLALEASFFRGGRLVYGLLQASASVLPQGLLPSRAEGGRRSQPSRMSKGQFDGKLVSEPHREAVDSILLPKRGRARRLSQSRLPGAWSTAVNAPDGPAMRLGEASTAISQWDGPAMSDLLQSQSTGAPDPRTFSAGKTESLVLSKRKADDIDASPNAPWQQPFEALGNKKPAKTKRLATTSLSPSVDVPSSVPVKPTLPDYKPFTSDGLEEPPHHRASSEDPIAEMDSIAPRADNKREYTIDEDLLILGCWDGRGALCDATLRHMKNVLKQAGYRERSTNALKWRVKNKLSQLFEAKRLDRA